MDPKKLLYFVAVVEQGSLKKAAGVLHVSQPALSTSMDRLEASLGVKLLLRGPSGVTPTSVGELIYSHARLIKNELEQAEKKIRNESQRGKATLTFGALPSLASSIVPVALGRWRQDFPAAHIRIVEKVQVELLIGLLCGELDFFIGMTEYYDFLDGLRQRVLFRDQQCVFARPHHPVFRAKSINWADLAEFPWICPMVGSQRTVLESLMTAEGVLMPSRLTEGGSVQFVKSLVAASDHLAMLPTHTLSDDVSEGRLQALSITAPQLYRNIAAFHRERSTMNKASRSLVAHVESVGSGLCREELPYIEAMPHAKV